MKSKSLSSYIFMIIPWTILLAAFIFSMRLIAGQGLEYLDSDQAAELILASLQNAEKSFLSSNWNYGSSLRIFEVTAFMRLGFLLSPDSWHTARVIGQGILLVLMAASYIYMASAVSSVRASVYTASALMLPFSYWHMFHVIMFGFYAPYIITTALTAGFLIRIYKILPNVRKHPVKLSVLTILSSLLAFFNALGSVRMIMNLYLPMLAASVWLLLEGFIRADSGDRIRKKHDDSNRRSSGRSVTADFAAQIIFLAVNVLIMASALAGYIINVRVLTPKYPYNSADSQSWAPLSLSGLLDALSLFFENLGHPVNLITENTVPVVSLNGILGAFGIVLAVIFVISLCRSLHRYHRSEASERYTLVLLLSVMFVVSVTFGCMTLETNASYWLPILPLVLLCLQLEIKNECFSADFLAPVCAGLAGLCFVCSSACQVRLMPDTLFRAQKGIHEAVAYCEDNNLKTGLAMFWQSDVAAALSEGKLEMYTVSDISKLDIYEWLQPISHNERPEGEVFLLMKKTRSTEHMLEDLPYGSLPCISVVFDNDEYIVLTCSDTDAMYEAADNS